MYDFAIQKRWFSTTSLRGQLGRFLAPGGLLGAIWPMSYLLVAV